MNSLLSLFSLLTLFSITLDLVLASPTTSSPAALALTFNQGFWSGKVKAGASELELVVDTGSYALVINEGSYQPSKNSVQTPKRGALEFNGANENGTQFTEVYISYVNDSVSISGYDVAEFLVGNITSQSDLLPSDGVLGLSQVQAYNNTDDQNDVNGQSFVQTLCDLNLIEECGFGLLFGKHHRGELVFGQMDRSKYAGKVQAVKTTLHDDWAIDRETTPIPKIVVNSKEVMRVNLSFDSGGPATYAPYSEGISLFEASNATITEVEVEGGKVAFGTYVCSSPPPKIGFLLNDEAIEDTLYFDDDSNILSKEMEDGAEICRLNILASTFLFKDQGWSVGQSFFQGRYVQHQINEHELRFAQLK